MLRDSLGLTDVGAKNFRRGVFFCTLANLVLMAPIGILFLLVSDFMDHLVAGAPLPALAPYLAGCVGILALMVLTQWAEYANTYHKVYEESARKRTDLLTAGVTDNLRKVTSYAAKHEARFMKLLIEQNEDGGKRRNAARKKELDAAEKRIAELSAVFKRLYHRFH